MRPVLAIPFLAGDLRPCLESIDLDVRLIVIDNSPNGETWDIVPDDCHIIDMPGNLGYPASLNLVIKALPHEDYWLFANHDVIFAPGDLQRLVGQEGGWVGVNDWRVFKLTAETVIRVGLFDENFHPAYAEDADYERRCTLAGVRWGVIQGETSHVGSAVIKGYPEYARANSRSYPSNLRYFRDKWGAEVRGPGGYETPFDSGAPLSAGTEPALSRLRANAWRGD